MTPLQRRFKAVIARLGDAISTVHGSGSALVSKMTVGQAKVWFDDATAAAFGRPIRSFYVGYDDPTAAGDTLTWAGGSVTVKKVVELRFQSSIVAKMLIAA